MRCAFVVRLGQHTQPTECAFEGWVEEVDTGMELRFHSHDELLRFLGERFLAIMARRESEESPCHCPDDQTKFEFK
jgi:hypothetical protein